MRKVTTPFTPFKWWFVNVFLSHAELIYQSWKKERKRKRKPIGKYNLFSPLVILAFLFFFFYLLLFVIIIFLILLLLIFLCACASSPHYSLHTSHVHAVPLTDVWCGYQKRSRQRTWSFWTASKTCSCSRRPPSVCCIGMCKKKHPLLSRGTAAIPLLFLSHEKVTIPFTPFKWWFVCNYAHE